MVGVAAGFVAQLQRDRFCHAGYIQFGKVDDSRVEALEQNLVFAVGTLVAKRIGGRQLFVVIILVLIGFEHKRSLIEVVFCLFVVAVFYDYSFEFLFFVYNVEFIDLDFRFIVFLVGVGHLRRCKERDGNMESSNMIRAVYFIPYGSVYV